MIYVHVDPERLMPFTYTIDPAQRLVTFTAIGVLTKDELLACREQLENDPRFNTRVHRLIDLAQFTDIQVSSEEVSFLAHSDKAGPGTRRAIVANSAFAFGLARMYEQLRQTYRGDLDLTTRVFHDLPSALRWLLADDSASESEIPSSL